MTTEELTAIRQRWARVPNGPWESHYTYRLNHFHEWLMTAKEGKQLIFAAHINTLDNEWSAPDEYVQVALAAAADDIAALLNEVRWLQRVLDEAHDQIEALT